MSDKRTLRLFAALAALAATATGALAGEKTRVACVGDYRKANPKARFFIWTKLSPLAEGQNFYRSPEPFLMQTDLDEVAKRMDAVGIDMQEPLREKMDEIFAKDKIHPNAEGALFIFLALTGNVLSSFIVRQGTPPSVLLYRQGYHGTAFALKQYTNTTFPPPQFYDGIQALHSSGFRRPRKAQLQYHLLGTTMKKTGFCT